MKRVGFLIVFYTIIGVYLYKDEIKAGIKEFKFKHEKITYEVVKEVWIMKKLGFMVLGGIIGIFAYKETKKATKKYELVIKLRRRDEDEDGGNNKVL